MTLRLAPRVAHLTAVEVDRDLVAALPATSAGNVDLVRQDFLEFDLGALPAAGPLRVAGNLPYNVVVADPASSCSTRGGDGAPVATRR